MLFEVQLVINNAPLTYVYPNTIETCLTPNHYLFGRQLLYSSNATSTVARNLTVLSSTTDKLNRISNYFWHRWGHEYVVNLRETQRILKLNIKKVKRCRETFGELSLTGVSPRRDSEKRGPIVRISKANRILKRPVNKLFPIENTYQDTNQTGTARE